MNCLTCELTRAKMYAKVQHAFKKDLNEIADKLSERFGERYYVAVSIKNGVIRNIIRRASKLPPYESHTILKVVR